MNLHYPPAHAQKMRAMRRVRVPRCTGRRPAASAHPARHCNGYCRPGLAPEVLTNTSKTSTSSESSCCRPSANQYTARLHNSAPRRNIASTGHHHRSHSHSTRGTPRNIPPRRNQLPGPRACQSASPTPAPSATGRFNLPNTTRPRARATKFYHRCTNKARSRFVLSQSSQGSTPIVPAKLRSMSDPTRVPWKVAIGDSPGRTN